MLSHRTHTAVSLSASPYFRLSLRIRANWETTIEALIQRAPGLRLMFVHRRKDTNVFGIDAPVGQQRRELAWLVRRLSAHPGVRSVRWEVVPTGADAFAPFS